MHQEFCIQIQIMVENECNKVLCQEWENGLNVGKRGGTGLVSWRLCADNKPGREGTSHMSFLKTTNKPGNVNDLSETLSQLPRSSSP